MMERILARPNLLQAIKRVEKNKGSHGVDQMTTKDLRMHLTENWTAIVDSLGSGTYQPKPGGGIRKLGIPTVTDRFINRPLPNN
ncbi:hypothetical protein GCM10027286_13970 [Virgibacillus ainsalahensis]